MTKIRINYNVYLDRSIKGGKITTQIIPDSLDTWIDDMAWNLLNDEEDELSSGVKAAFERDYGHILEGISEWRYTTQAITRVTIHDVRALDPADELKCIASKELLHIR